ncbi:PREDICTED: 2-oxoglutarate-Fe(II) type oxidoreductase isoform X2 [Ipomoea nil]|uniref:2-oxoglutarate-Fe(II) type oxidoreductase isoform X2 n=1 Tax=Ipomoea nil TaxID=35883 RepID=UPI000900D858|nr:PREDICTED: 2-oxoglutarate-Fe(II) type oxidoreductase isoform X2 [Ipomoea nil]
MANSLQLPVIDLCSPDRTATARAVRRACMEYGFFYLINHGVEETLFRQVFEQSRRFFSLPLEEKMKLDRKLNRGYTPLYAEKLDTSSSCKGDSKENFHIGPLEHSDLNQWPSEGVLPLWKATMEDYYERVLNAGKKLVSLIALALNLDEDFFDKAVAFNPPNGFLRLLHYPAVPGPLESPDQVIYGASAHSDYGMITLLATDGVPGLQVCREKFRQPRIWEDVPNLSGSTLHRVVPTGSERYSVAFFLDPNPDCLVECLESCCSESSPCRFPPIRSGDYLEERFRLTYGSYVMNTTQFVQILVTLHICCWKYRMLLKNKHFHPYIFIFLSLFF